MTFKEFIVIVEKMRFFQREYFATRRMDVLRAAKDMERRVDSALDEFKRIEDQKRLF